MSHGKPRPQRAPKEKRHAVPRSSRVRLFALFSAVVVLLLAGLAGLLWTRSENIRPASTPDTAPHGSPAYVGATTCGNCHQREYDAWQGSHHALAMRPANPDTVLADFGNIGFGYDRLTSHFFRRDGQFFVNTDDADGRLADFEIKYTFGVTPLQQYLVELPGGRLQALPFAWDGRGKEEGGQRWFHLYPKEKIDHRDPLHWTGPYQNWNYMCSDCHSTAVRHNYDIATDSFDTRWSEINVACEACHGPGAAHVDWAQGRAGSATPAASEGDFRGLLVRFDQRRPPNRLETMKRSTVLSFEEGDELRACAVCHARRTALTNAFNPAEGFDQHFLPAPLTSELYHVDGQIKDEVYEYNSFRQSKMFAKGITCSDCHEPHALRLRGDPATVCLQCHESRRYDTTEHHHHAASRLGCIDCHMPQTTYMQVDPRRDHSFRVPRPDVSVRHAVPNACNQCHRDRDARWAAQSVRAWLGRDARGFQQFANAFHAVRETTADAEQELRALLRDATVPPLVKGSLLADAGPFLATIVQELAQSLRSPFVAERLGALQAMGSLPTAQRWELGAPLLADTQRNVRVEAARLLVDPELSPAQRTRLVHALDELKVAARQHGSMPQWRMIAADVAAKEGDSAAAIREFEAALKIQPTFGRAYVNLADLYRTQGDEAQVRITLERGLKILPAEGALHYALGLHFIRMKQTRPGMNALKRATELAPGDAGFAYGYAVGLHSQGDTQSALAFLKRRLVRHPSERDNLYLLVQLALDGRQVGIVAPYRATLERLAPSDMQARRLLNQLRSAQYDAVQGP